MESPILQCTGLQISHGETNTKLTFFYINMWKSLRKPQIMLSTFLEIPSQYSILGTGIRNTALTVLSFYSIIHGFKLISLTLMIIQKIKWNKAYINTGKPNYSRNSSEKTWSNIPINFVRHDSQKQIRPWQTGISTLQQNCATQTSRRWRGKQIHLHPKKVKKCTIKSKRIKNLFWNCVQPSD